MSSSSNSSDSESDQPDDLITSGLVATRAKRRTAGNLYATLRANLDDEELQKELLAEDEAEDAEDYAVSDREDDDAAMESDESDEDAANAEGDEDEGERELKRAERAEGRKQKKAMDARMRVPGLVPKKRVRVIEEGEGEGDAEEAERRKKKKKSERSSWLPEGVDAPTRQSRRELAVKNREVIHANLKESAQRSEKQKKLMKDAAKRVRMTDRLPLTQEQRFEKCKRIEKETAKELGRTEREEAERIRLREEALAAKRKRDIEGPVMRTWSGSGVFEDGKLKVKRLGSKTMKEYEVEAKKREEEAREEARRKEEEARKEAEKREQEAREEARRQAEEAKRREEERLEEERKERERIEAARIEAEQAEAVKKENEKAAMDLIDWGGESSRPGTADERMEDAPTLGEPSETVDQTAATEDPPIEPPGEKHADEPVEPSNTWLSGIHEYAAQTEDKPGPDQVPYTPSAPAINAANIHSEASGLSGETPAQQDFAGAPSVQQHTSIQPSQLSTPSGPSTPTVAHSAQMQPSQPGVLPGTMTFSATPQPPVSTTTPQPPPPPPAPVLREQAQRTLLVLDSFPSLTYPQPPIKSRKSLLSSQSGPLDETPLSRTLIPNSHPSFTSEESRYLSRVLKRNKLDALPEPPQKPKCAVTGWAAKYTDPKTGLPYADLQTYKIVQRMVAGGSAWSGFLGAWVGPQTAVSLRMGRPARGVPEGFAPAGETVVKKEAEAEAAK